MTCSQVIGCMSKALDGKIGRKESEKGNHFAIEGFYRMVHIYSNQSQLQIPRTKT